MAYCVNHPVVETEQRCPSCGGPFCDACLVEFLGQRYCGPCRDRKLAEMEGATAMGGGAPLAGTGTVDVGGWLTAGWQIIEKDLITWCVASLLLFLLSGLSCYVCLPPLLCGMYMMAFRKMQYGVVEVGNMFDGFRRFLNAFLLGLLIFGVQMAVSLALTLPLMGAQATVGDNFGAVMGLNLLSNGIQFVVNSIIGGILFFSFPHIAARNANPAEAISASWEVVRRNPLMFILTAFLYQMIISIGVAALCVGVLVTMALVTAATAKAYADHFGIQGYDFA
ncbi:MAG: hypothetical protein ACK47B_17700 [Armatimonadota bacterium]